MKLALFPKKMTYIIFLACSFYQCNPPDIVTETEKLSYLAKSWGLAKYHHPDIGSGKINWDSVLITHIDLIRSTNSNDEFNQALRQMLDIPGQPKSRSVPSVCNFEDVESLVDFSWIKSSSLSESNQQILGSLLDKKEKFSNKYVSDSVGARSLNYARFYEDPMEDADMSQAANRLLGLFRYWNIIEYFFPYKDLCDQSWDEVLTEFIPRFLRADTKEKYYEELLLLSTRINDGHANIPFHPELRRAFFGQFRVPFSVRLLGDQLIVDGILSDSLCQTNNIKLGDQISSINGQELMPQVKNLGRYLPNPNTAFHNNEICRYLLNGNSNTLQLELRRDSESIQQTIQRYSFPDIRKYRDPKEVEPWKILDANIAYAHMGELNLEHLETFFSKIKNTKGLILDFRHYPNWEILYEFLSHFYNEVKPFVLLKSQCLDQPGTYYRHFSEKDIADIKPLDYEYDQPILILVNENTLSFGEYFVMALQVLENVSVIGTQTAGQDGNQVGIDMPGGMRMFMSSLGIYYPNGENSQRSGIKIDEVVPLKLEDIKSGTDGLLNYSISKLNSVN